MIQCLTSVTFACAALAPSDHEPGAGVSSGGGQGDAGHHAEPRLHPTLHEEHHQGTGKALTVT